MLQFERIDISEGIDLNKSDKSKSVSFVIIGILKTLVINMNHMFVMDNMIY